MTEPWANNILSFEPDVDPAQLLAHPLNARRHPGAQRDALRESLGRAGWVDVVKVNTRTGHVVDGHARVEEAITAGANVPVLYLDLSEEDERFVLATLDPISALATYDAEVLDQLLSGVDIESSGLLDMLADSRALAFGPADLDELDDLADEYDPGNTAGAASSLTLAPLSQSTLDDWASFRSGFDSDDLALGSLLG
jgi:hypothetical protein